MYQEFLTCGDLLPLMAVGCKEVNPERTSVGPEVMSRKALRLGEGGVRIPSGTHLYDSCRVNVTFEGSLKVFLFVFSLFGFSSWDIL